MPPSTKNREPLIVYLPREIKRGIEERARREDRSASRIASDLIGGQLTKEEADVLWMKCHDWTSLTAPQQTALKGAMAKIGPIAGRY